VNRSAWQNITSHKAHHTLTARPGWSDGGVEIHKGKTGDISFDFLVLKGYDGHMFCSYKSSGVLMNRQRGFALSEFSLDSPGVFFYSSLAVWINENNTFAIYLVNRNIFVYPKISGPVTSQRGDIVKVSDQQKSALQTILFCKQIKSHLAPCCNISEQYFTMNIVEVPAAVYFQTLYQMKLFQL